MKARILTLFVLTLFVFTSCEKETDDQVNPNEILISIALDKNDPNRRFVYLINEKGENIFKEVSGYGSYDIKRGNNFSGDKFDLHLIRYWINPQSWAIESYTSIDKGLIINEGSLLKSNKEKNVTCIELDFDQVSMPEYDILTRSSIASDLCFTDNSLRSYDDVYWINEYYNKFYTCFQDDNGGKYLLEEIPPETTGTYTISFENLNDDMIHKSYNKTYNDKNLSELCIVYSNIMLFNLEDPSIFKDKVDVYIPNLEEFNRFRTKALFNGLNENYFTVVNAIGDVPDEFKLPNVDFNVTPNNNTLPVLEYNEGEYDIIIVYINTENGIWVLKTNKPNIDFPEIEELNNEELFLSQLFDSINSVSVSFINFSNLNKDYQELMRDAVNREDDYYYKIDHILTANRYYYSFEK